MRAGPTVRSCLGHRAEGGAPSEESVCLPPQPPNPTYPLWPHLAGFLSFVPPPAPWLSVPFSTVLGAGLGGHISRPFVLQLQLSLVNGERGVKEHVKSRYLFSFSFPKGHHGPAHPSTKGQVALSTHLCPSKFYTCSVPSPGRPRGGARVPPSEPWGTALSLGLPAPCPSPHSQLIVLSPSPQFEWVPHFLADSAPPVFSLSWQHSISGTSLDFGVR